MIGQSIGLGITISSNSGIDSESSNEDYGNLSAHSSSLDYKSLTTASITKNYQGL